jgi:hypothetical protein
MKLKISKLRMKSQFRSIVSIGLGFLAYGLLVFFTGNSSICIFKVYTGLPCPGCGMTRSFMSVFHGKFHEAFYWHPLWIWVVIGSVLYATVHFWHSNSKQIRKSIVNISLILLISVYVIRMILLFPHTAPLDFNPNAIPIRIYQYINRI